MTPKKANFYFPAEWQAHAATWLSFPHNLETWENRLKRIYPAYFEFISEVSKEELVAINVPNAATKAIILKQLEARSISRENIQLWDIPTNDSWCRDHGPCFVINKEKKQKAIVNWQYNAWGGKYPPFEADNNVPNLIASQRDLQVFQPNIIMEGGSIEVNGAGSLLTSRSCLLNKNRNPQLSQTQIEQYLKDYYGVNQILWVNDGIVGDDTDGHIDDTTRFINANTVLTAIETNRLDSNYQILKDNLGLLKKMTLPNNEKLNILELPMPEPVIDAGQRLPASYANFYICNNKVIVPTYNCPNDDKALEIISNCFPNRKVIGINSTEIIWGLGSFHCLSQQEPLV